MEKLGSLWQKKIFGIIFGWSEIVCVCEQHNSKAKCNRMLKIAVLNIFNREMLLETFKWDQ